MDSSVRNKIFNSSPLTGEGRVGVIEYSFNYHPPLTSHQGRGLSRLRDMSEDLLVSEERSKNPKMESGDG